MQNSVAAFWDRAIPHHFQFAGRVLPFRIGEKSYELHPCHGDSFTVTGDRIVAVGKRLSSAAVPDDVEYLLAHQDELPEWVSYYVHVLPHCTSDMWSELGYMQVLTPESRLDWFEQEEPRKLREARFPTHYTYGKGLRCLVAVS